MPPTRPLLFAVVTMVSPTPAAHRPGTRPKAARPALTVYSTAWCGHCVRLKAQLQRAGIEFVEVDIESSPSAARTVAKVNRGNLTVPTLVFADGSALTNPPVARVATRLAELA